MFVDVQNKILEALKQLTDFKTVGVWQGDIDELLENPQKLPSAHTIFSAADFEEPTTIGGTVAPIELVWSVIIISQNLNDRKSGGDEVLDILDNVLPKLTRLNTGHGPLWPTAVRLIAAKSGKIAYGFHFKLEKGQVSR